MMVLPFMILLIDYIEYSAITADAIPSEVAANDIIPFARRRPRPSSTRLLFLVPRRVRRRQDCFFSSTVAPIVDRFSSSDNVNGRNEPGINTFADQRRQFFL